MGRLDHPKSHANNTATVYDTQNIRYNIQCGKMLRQKVQQARRDETIPMDGHQSRYGNLVGTADSLDGC